MFMPVVQEFEIDADRMTAADRAISPLEWRVVLLARRDADRPGWETSATRFPWLRRMIEALTGLGGVPRLADQRLEKLRLFICMRRRGDSRAEAVGAELVAMGLAPLALCRLEAAAMR
jgi:hypothetical protein